MLSKYDYDAIVIGAGVGGLVCGCYLAKAGLKTVIIEKNPKVGGYCTSFSSKGFSFDTFVHSLGSCRKNGNITKIIEELNLTNEITLNRSDPSDIIITPNHRIFFWSDFRKTIQEFQENFPKEAKNIKDFFSYLLNHNNISLVSIRNNTFKDLLDRYFANAELKAILGFPVLGNIGLPPSLASAFAALKLYQEFMFDGGYYPSGNMQTFADVLAHKFNDYGGELILSNLVKKIDIKNNKTMEIILAKKNISMSSKYVISNIDAIQTFSCLLGETIVDKHFLNKLSTMKTSLSMFILYLGFDNEIEKLPKEGSNVWYLPHYDIEKLYIGAEKRGANNIAEYMMHIFTKKNISIFINANFDSKEYWNAHKEEISIKLIKKLEISFPCLSQKIVYRQMTTPYVLYKTTLNQKGAAYGWASMPSQFAEPGLTQITPIENLYLCSHWSTLAQGVGGVAYLGNNTAKLILRKERINSK